MMMIQVFIPGKPIAQPRQRHSARFVGGKVITRNYTPQDAPVHAFRSNVVHFVTQQWQQPPSDKPFRVDIRAIWPRPGNMIWKKKPMPREWKTSKPDRDNVEKAIYDSLEKIVWLNDSQIVSGVTEKFFASGDERPGTHLTITEL